MVNTKFTIRALSFTIRLTLIAILKITEPNGRSWETSLTAGSTYEVGRAKENDIVLNDRRVSRKHAFISPFGTRFRIIDGHLEDGNLIRSVNRLFINGLPQMDAFLEDGDIVTIGETSLEFKSLMNPSRRVPVEPEPPPSVLEIPEAQVQQTDETLSDEPPSVNYDDSPLGHTQLQISANEIMGKH